MTKDKCNNDNEFVVSGNVSLYPANDNTLIDIYIKRTQPTPEIEMTISPS